LKLDQRARLLKMQFSFSNPSIISPLIPCFADETVSSHVVRKQARAGRRIIDPVKNVNIAGFVHDLEHANWRLCNARRQKRVNIGVDKRSKIRHYHMVRFIFAPTDSVFIASDLVDSIADIRANLLEICKTSLWRVRAYDMLYCGENASPDDRMISINFELRVPLVDSDGQEIRQWRRGQRGGQLGRSPVPIQPQFELRCHASVIKLVPWRAM